MKITVILESKGKTYTDNILVGGKEWTVEDIAEEVKKMTERLLIDQVINRGHLPPKNINKYMERAHNLALKLIDETKEDKLTTDAFINKTLANSDRLYEADRDQKLRNRI